MPRKKAPAPEPEPQLEVVETPPAGVTNTPEDHPEPPGSLAAELQAAKAEGRPPRIRLAGWRVQANDWFKDGTIRLSSSGRVEWRPEDIDTVTQAELEQLLASAPGNWNKLERVHVTATD